VVAEKLNITATFAGPGFSVSVWKQYEIQVLTPAWEADALPTELLARRTALVSANVRRR